MPHFLFSPSQSQALDTEPQTLITWYSPSQSHASAIILTCLSTGSSLMEATRGGSDSGVPVGTPAHRAAPEQATTVVAFISVYSSIETAACTQGKQVLSTASVRSADTYPLWSGHVVIKPEVPQVRLCFCTLHHTPTHACSRSAAHLHIVFNHCVVQTQAQWSGSNMCF